MEQMIEELAEYYAALGFPMYSLENLQNMDDEEIENLYEMTFPTKE